MVEAELGVRKAEKSRKWYWETGDWERLCRGP